MQPTPQELALAKMRVEHTDELVVRRKVEGTKDEYIVEPNASGFLRYKIWEMFFLCKQKGRYREQWDLRGFWYWLKAGLLRHEGYTVEPYEPEKKEPWVRRRMKQLSKCLSDLVKDRVFDYSDLLLIDEDRLMKLVHDPTWYKDVIVFVEKNTVYRKVKSVAELFDITIVSGRGQQGTAAIEKMIKNIQNSREYTVVFLTDYDAAGAFIAHSFAERCEILGLTVTVERAGINPEHIPDEHKDVCKYPVSTRGLKKEFVEKWIADNPLGIYGFELEAVNVFLEDGYPELRRILVRKLLEVCPEEILYDHFLDEEKELVPEKVVDGMMDDLEPIAELQSQIDELEEKLGKMKSTVSGYLLPIAETEIENIDDEREIPEGTLEKYAVKGKTYSYYSEFTDTDELESDLKTHLLDMIKDEEITLPEIAEEEESDEEPDFDPEEDD